MKKGGASSSKAPFDPESEESGSSSSESGVEDVKNTSTLSVGWSKFHEAAKATFNKQVSKQGTVEKKIRPYDNTNRAAQAKYQRQGDAYKSNGQDSARISQLLATDLCLCALLCSL